MIFVYVYYLLKKPPVVSVLCCLKLDVLHADCFQKTNMSGGRDFKMKQKNMLFTLTTRQRAFKLS